MGHNSRKMQRPSCRAPYVAGIELAGESKEPRNPGRQGPSSPSGGRGTPTLGDFLPPDRLHKHKWGEQAGLPPPAPESRTFHRLPPPNKPNRNPQTPQSTLLNPFRRHSIKPATNSTNVQSSPINHQSTSIKSNQPSITPREANPLSLDGRGRSLSRVPRGSEGDPPPYSPSPYIPPVPN